MQLILVVPGLLALRTAGPEAVRAPGLARLLAMAGTPARADGGTAAALAAHYGVLRQADWPLAPIRLAALGVDPGAAFWLAADPVTLVVGRDDVRLSGVVADLTPDDAAALLATLNAHFAGDGLAFVAPRPDAIFVRAAAGTRLSTHRPDAAPDRSLRHLLPEGADADAWRRWHTEIEMLLHGHPVNVARESTGRPPVSGLWFSCGGTLPPRREPAPSIRTFATHGIAAALAAHAGSPARALPPGLDAALHDAGGAEAVVVALEPAPDPSALERAWAKPADDALAAGRLAAVTLLTDGDGEAIVWQARHHGFWRRLGSRYVRHDLAALLDAAAAER